MFPQKLQNPLALKNPPNLIRGSKFKKKLGEKIKKLNPNPRFVLHPKKVQTTKPPGLPNLPQ